MRMAALTSRIAMDVVDHLLLDPEFVDELYQRYQRDPGSVDESWAALFRSFDRGYAAGRPRAIAQSPSRTARAAISAGEHEHFPPGIQIYDLVHTFREHGHLIAAIDPLGRGDREHPFLALEQFGFTTEDLDREVTCAGFHGTDRATVRNYIAILRETYCGPVGVEYTDIMDADRRDWLQKRMEPIRNRPRLTTADKRQLLQELIAADTFEETLHTMYLGAKRFSLEGSTTLIPLLRTIIDQASQGEVEQIVLGMAHRGRLNVLAHVMGKPMEYILAEFEGRPLPKEVQGYGDVKYHMGYSSDYVGSTGRQVHLSMAFNPSHLETINPVVEGIVRAKQRRLGDRDGRRVIPILVHGDAAFAGQGVVAETFTLAGLQGYGTGGTIHIIVNNQVGFTADPEESRSTRYASDIAKIIRAPVFHLNADHPETSYLFAQLALGYRQAFGSDVVIDLVGFRRHGHNELDDASFTQPLMAELIKSHAPVSKIYGDKLKLASVVSDADVTAMTDEVRESMRIARDVAQGMPKQVVQRLEGAWTGITDAGEDWSADTSCPASTLESIAHALVTAPKDFHWHPRLRRLMQDRCDRILSNREIDWGCGEALAFGSLLTEGTSIRLSGQDSGRGTFSHRHAIYTDMKSGARYVPLNHVRDGQETIEVLNSPLSEEAVLGFEYGYSAADPWSLVVWEAQFGDFANGAQVMIDQLLASAEYKWGRMSGLVLLLPHGYEGQGPEHSSARLERFLELCAENNLQVVNLTTPAQLFHCLRRQVKRTFRKPLVVMSPKSLLRHPLAVSRVRDFTHGHFERLIDDVDVGTDESRRSKVKRVLLTSGKIYYPLLERRREGEIDHVAIVRVEELYPFPLDQARAVLASYPNLEEVLWVQEEPRNMGAWRNLRHRFEASCPKGIEVHYVGRDSRAVPATGMFDVHQREEADLVTAAFGNDASAWVIRRETGTSVESAKGKKSPATAA